MAHRGELSDEAFATLLGLFYRRNELIEKHLREALAWPTIAVAG